MSVGAGGEERREGLFSAIKNLSATFLAIGKTRAELLVTEIEEEKYRLVALWSKAVGAAVLLALGLIMLVFCLVVAFWEQRLLILGVMAGLFLVSGCWLVVALRHQAAQPSKLFRASLAELETDMAQLRGRDGSSPP